MSIAEALKVIQSEFKRRFDVEISMYISIHRTSDGLEPSRENAERIIRTVANEVGMKGIRHEAWEEGEYKCSWVTATTEDWYLKITAFYPYIEYHQTITEGNNERESGT